MSTTSPIRKLRPRQAEDRIASTTARRASVRSVSQCCITRVVEHVAIARNVSWHELFSVSRGSPKVAAARGLAMAICAALEVPHFLIARAFSRTWATVYAAESRCSRHYRENPTFRNEWNSLIKTCQNSKSEI